jgi:hypothetical protein
MLKTVTVGMVKKTRRNKLNDFKISFGENEMAVNELPVWAEFAGTDKNGVLVAYETKEEMDCDSDFLVECFMVVFTDDLKILEPIAKQKIFTDSELVEVGQVWKHKDKNYMEGKNVEVVRIDDLSEKNKKIIALSFKVEGEGRNSPFYPIKWFVENFYRVE